MLKISEDGLFFISMPENVIEDRIINVNMASINGQMISRQALIDNMMSCFKCFHSNIEEALEIIFHVNYEGTTFVICVNTKMSFEDLNREIKRYFK